MMNIPIAKTEFTEREKQNILNVLESGWIVQGKYVQQFEEQWSEFTGSKHSIAVTSCTTALQLSLAAIGIKPGDEVIVPSFTWIATANVVEMCFAKPVFCDININTFNIDPALIEALITPKTKAIIPVHLFGLPAEMESIIDIATKYNLHIIEDAACGFGARIKGTHVGNFGNTGCFSFHPRKAITTGEGGMITTNDEHLAKKLRSMRDHGAAISDLQRHLGNKPYLLPDFPYAGFNFRMTDIQAALGVGQMERAEEILSKRNHIAERYDNFFATQNQVKIYTPPLGSLHGHQSYIILFSSESISLKNISKVHNLRNNFMEYLLKKGISTRPGTHAVHTLSYYKNKYNLKHTDYLNSYIADQCTIAFPVYQRMTEGELNYIFDTISGYNDESIQ